MKSYFRCVGLRVVHFGFGWGIFEVDNHEDPKLVEYPLTEEGLRAAQAEVGIRNRQVRGL